MIQASVESQYYSQERLTIPHRRSLDVSECDTLKTTYPWNSMVLLTLDVRGCILRNGHEQSTMLAVTSDLGEFRLVSNG
ncbi:hypothetical protein KUF71_021180 [Frankliniella fusca]|uniref:Uncharacterized protein n=1 Tax=Frankliniella fusca TaxID=407009 RepID=A0AAE1LAX2_9NEOP|nr:hypothetical protein KUF71_021180 [Frankliniella fusca]